jgi:peptidoglycan/xylan/chitin deacetylase (PgdA/CDA1 family)
MYHRVADETCDPWGLCVTPRHFEQQMQVLRRSFSVMPIREIVAFLQEGKIPRRSVAITFDDGYADNVHAAKPILERYDCPGTFFIVSDHIDSQLEFWWDELDRLLLQPGTLPDRCEFDIDGKLIREVLGGASNYSKGNYDHNRSWRAWENPPTPRHSLYYSLWRQMRPMTDHDRRGILDAIRRWAGTDSQARPSHRALSHSELATVAQNRSIDIGCHTITHPQLSSLPPSMQSDEIRGCKQYLEKFLDRPVENFAYPFGGQEDYTADTVSLVREMGFSSACSTLAGLVDEHSDPFQLPRMPVEDWDGEEFEVKLSEWFDEAMVRPK